MSEVAIVRSPQRDQQFPISALNSLHSHASALVVAREIERCLKNSSNESLVVVRGRIYEVPDDLLARPAARQYRLNTSPLTNFVKPRLCYLDQGQQLFTELSHFLLDGRRSVGGLFGWFWDSPEVTAFEGE